MYRVFGSPFALCTHQAALVLKHKRVPFMLHSSSFWMVKLAAWYHGAASCFCVQSPQGASTFNLTELVNSVEQQFPQLPMLSCDHGDAEKLVLQWAFRLYCEWWLLNLGMMFRWSLNEGCQSSIEGHAAFHLITSGAIPPLAKGMGRAIRDSMRENLKHYGVSRTTHHYFLDHFVRMCDCLEQHFAQCSYVLGTPTPTLSDVVLAACFEAFFMKDDPPQSDLNHSFPRLVEWAKGICRGPEDSDSAKVSVGKSAPIQALILEVLPHLVVQRDVFEKWLEGPRPPPNYQKPDGTKAYRSSRLLSVPWNCQYGKTLVTGLVSLPHLRLGQEACVDLLRSNTALAADAPIELVNLRDMILRLGLSATIDALPDKGADFDYIIS